MNDTAEKVRFDLESGSVRGGGGERLLLMPSSALEQLGAKAGIDVACGLSRFIGAAIGKSVLTRLGSKDAVRSASLESVVQALASDLAVAGWGAASLERWGRAMVMLVAHPPVAEAQYVAAILEGAVHEATGRDVRCLPLGSAGADGPLRILVAGEGAIGRARGWLAEGVAWGDVLVRLQASQVSA
jgi:hypothetical protein